MKNVHDLINVRNGQLVLRTLLRNNGEFWGFGVEFPLEIEILMLLEGFFDIQMNRIDFSVQTTSLKLNLQWQGCQIPMERRFMRSFKDPQSKY